MRDLRSVATAAPSAATIDMTITFNEHGNDRFSTDLLGTERLEVEQLAPRSVAPWGIDRSAYFLLLLY